MKDVDVLSVTIKGHAQLPRAWRERAGLKLGGVVRVVELGDPEHSLRLTPIQRPAKGAKGLAALLRTCPAELSVPERHRLPFR